MLFLLGFIVVTGVAFAQGGKFFILPLIYSVLMYGVYRHKKARDLTLSKRIKTTFDSGREITGKPSSETNLLKIVDPIIDRIDMNMDSAIFSHNNVRLKCIQSGIRSPMKQKSIVFIRYLLILPAIVVGLMIGNLLFPEDLKIAMVISLICGGLGFAFPIIRLNSIIDFRKKEIDRVFPDFVDLMLVCVEAGMTAEQAYVRIADEIKEFSLVMADEVKILSAETTYFLDAKIAYDNFIYRTQNAYTKAFCTVIMQSIQYGTPLSQGLRALSAEIRQSQMGFIERKAQSLPAKLTVPMMLFTLPVLFVVIAYPAAIQVMEQL